MINGYDFDGTIYDGDSSVDFYFFCLKKNKKVLLQLPIQIWGAILYILRIIDKTAFKEKVFSFLKQIDNVDDYIKEFWTKKYSKIKSWYFEQKEDTDIIISASPEFLLKPLEKKLNVKIMATKVDKKTGKFIGKNCYGTEKVRRFKEKIKNKNLKAFYSDSMSDKPMMDISKEAYYVKKNIRYNLKNDREGKIAKYLKIDKKLYKFGILFLVIPVIIKLVFWYNRMISIPCIILLLATTYLVMKKYKALDYDKYYKIFTKKKIILLVILIIIINLLFSVSGILNCSLAFWLPEAIVGNTAGFRVASLFMLLWQTLVITIVFYYACRFLSKLYK